jgi:hypothetical protein
MKPIQVLFDEPLLKRLDADEEVRADGRSAVLRRAAADYLRKRRAKRVSDMYRRAYGGSAGLGDEFSGWTEQGTWPEK